MSVETLKWLIVVGICTVVATVGYLVIKGLFLGVVSAAKAASEAPLTVSTMQVVALQAARLVCYVGIGALIYWHVAYVDLVERIDEEQRIAVYVGSACQVILFHGLAVALGLVSRLQTLGPGPAKSRRDGLFPDFRPPEHGIVGSH